MCGGMLQHHRADLLNQDCFMPQAAQNRSMFHYGHICVISVSSLRQIILSPSFFIFRPVLPGLWTSTLPWRGHGCVYHIYVYID